MGPGQGVGVVGGIYCFLCGLSAEWGQGSTVALKSLFLLLSLICMHRISFSFRLVFFPNDCRMATCSKQDFRIPLSDTLGDRVLSTKLEQRVLGSESCHELSRLGWSLGQTRQVHLWRFVWCQSRPSLMAASWLQSRVDVGDFILTPMKIKSRTLEDHPLFSD